MMDNESAELEFMRFCDDWDIDTIVDEFDEDDRNSFNKFKRQIVRKIRSKNLTYQDDETFLFELVKPLKDGTKGEDLTIRRTHGDSWMGMDSYKKDQQVHQGMSKTAALIKKPLSFISRLDDVDVKVLQAVQALFLNS